MFDATDGGALVDFLAATIVVAVLRQLGPEGSDERAAAMEHIDEHPLFALARERLAGRGGEIEAFMRTTVAPCAVDVLGEAIQQAG